MNRFKDRSVIGTIFLLLLLTTAYAFSTAHSAKPDILDNLQLNNSKLVYGWSTAQVVSIESDLRSLRPSIAIDKNDNVHFVWLDQTDLEGNERKMAPIATIATIKGNNQVTKL